MQPVRHGASNLVYRGPTPDIGDLWCQRVKPHEIRVVYEFSDSDREQIAAGGRVELAMYSEPIPPISVVVLPEGMCKPVAPHGWKGQTEDDPVGFPSVFHVFHLRDGFFFASHEDGRVTIQIRESAHDDAHVLREITIPENEWASVLATCSRRGENAETWQAAREFHLEPSPEQPKPA